MEEVEGTDKTFPTRPLEMIVPSHPGGGTDILVRLLAESVEQFLGEKVFQAEEVYKRAF